MGIEDGRSDRVAAAAKDPSHVAEGPMPVAVVGAGSWGTAIAQLLASKGDEVRLWARKASVVEGVNTSHRNPRYLTDVALSPRVVASTSMEECVRGARMVAVVTPSAVVRSTARALAPLVQGDAVVVACSKGVEEGTGELASQQLAAELGRPDRVAVLSGPTHAEEVVRLVPSAAVAAASSRPTALFVQNAFATPAFRVYASDDEVGVELCGAMKNVMAIAVGMSYGMGFGDNTAAMIMTRGLAEMGRLVTALGGKAITCMGLAGMGDLVVTCQSEHSRNRRLGEGLAHGKTLDDFHRETHMVAEGALACKTVGALARSAGVETPIVDTVRAVLWEGADAHKSAEALVRRPLTSEFYGFGGAADAPSGHEGGDV